MSGHLSRRGWLGLLGGLLGAAGVQRVRAAGTEVPPAPAPAPPVKEPPPDPLWHTATFVYDGKPLVYSTYLSGTGHATAPRPDLP
jgi:hypothetical protein